MSFFKKIVASDLKIDLFGRNFNYVEDKWDAIAPYRYSIAYENYSGDHYWTEKLADVLICETMPIYYGCQNVERYFPRESIVTIKPDDKHVVEKIKEIVNSSAREDNIEAIRESKYLILNKYNMLARLASEVEKHASFMATGKEKKIEIKRVKPAYPYRINYKHILRWPLRIAKNLAKSMKMKNINRQ